MTANALQDVDEIRGRIDVVQTTGRDQALDDADMFGTKLRPAEEPGPSAHGDGPESALQMVGIHRHLGIFKEDPQAGFTLQHVVQRLEL